MSNNMVKVGQGFYIVKTPAGFRKAAKHGWDGPPHADTWKDEFEMMQGYPKEYPSLVRFTDGYFGYHFIRALCIPVSKIERALSNVNTTN